MNKIDQQQVTSGELLVCALLELVIVRIAYRIDRSKTIPLLSTAAWAIILGIVRAHDIRLDPQVIFLGLVPPIILEAGYMTQHRGFFANFWDIFLLGIVGTILSTLLIGIILVGLSKTTFLPITLTSAEAVLYGSLISAIDPIATQLVLRKSHVPSLVPELVFGERSLNNAISVAVFMLCQGRVITGENQLSFFIVANMFLELIAVGFGSLLLAIIVGYSSAFLLRHSDDALKQYPAYEISTLLLFAYACYLAGEVCHLSGHLCVFFSGAFIRHYHMHNISKASATTFKHLLRTVAFLAENFIFIYLGVSVFAYSNALEWNWSFIIISFFVCLIVRAMTTFPLCLLAGQWRIHPIPVQYMIVIWFSGLRGAIAFALSLTVDSVHGGMFRSATLCTVLVTTIGFTVGMGPLVSLLQLAHTCEEHAHLRLEGQEQPPILSSSEEEEATWIRDAWNAFDRQHLQPHFGQG